MLGYVFSIQSSVDGAITVVKLSLFPAWIQSILLYVSLETDPFRCEQTSVV